MTERLQPGDVVDRFTVESVLGEGGMAVVYRVRHNILGSPAALKVLTIHSQRIRSRLVLEGRVQAQLRHPNIVGVNDVIDVNGAPGLVMEMVEGPTLHTWLREVKPGVALALKVFDGVVAGVARAHRVGLIHRDLKPANVLMAMGEDELRPMVADFGLAKALEGDGVEEHRTRTGIGMGTPAYMAPEQFDSASEVDARADVFALGCILYEVLCHTRVFSGRDMFSLMEAARYGRYDRPNDVVPGLPDYVVAAIDGCLKPSRDDRVTDAGVLRQLLKRRECWAVEMASSGLVGDEWAAAEVGPSGELGARGGGGLVGLNAPSATGRPRRPAPPPVPETLSDGFGDGVSSAFDVNFGSANTIDPSPPSVEEQSAPLTVGFDLDAEYDDSVGAADAPNLPAPARSSAPQPGAVAPTLTPPTDPEEPEAAVLPGRSPAPAAGVAPSPYFLRDASSPRRPVGWVVGGILALMLVVGGGWMVSDSAEQTRVADGAPMELPEKPVQAPAGDPLDEVPVLGAVEELPPDASPPDAAPPDAPPVGDSRPVPGPAATVPGGGAPSTPGDAMAGVSGQAREPSSGERDAPPVTDARSRGPAALVPATVAAEASREAADVSTESEPDLREGGAAAATAVPVEEEPTDDAVALAAEETDPVVTTGTVRLNPGAAQQLWLKSESGRQMLAGSVPAGRYQLMPYFPSAGADPVPGASITVGAGQVIRIDCSETTLSCWAAN